MEHPTLVQYQQNNADEEDEIPQPTQQPTPADNSNGADHPSQEGGAPQPPGGPGGGGDGGGGTPFIPPPPPGPPPAPWPGPGNGGPPAPPPGPPPADQPEPDPVHQPYDGGGHVRERLRPKESDEVKILAFPTGSQWRAWRGNTFASIVSAAGRQDDLAQAWILQVETADPAELEYPGEGWVSLDRKIAASLTKMAHGEIGREITQKSNTRLNNNTIARGRVLLAIVLRYYASGQNGQAMYDMNHLQTLVMKGDNLEAFHNTWNMVMSELSHVPEDTTLQFWYFRQIEHFKPHVRGHSPLQKG